MPVIGAPTPSGGETPDGLPRTATSQKRWTTTFIPTTIAGTDFDTLFAPDPKDEQAIIEDGGTPLHAVGSYFSADALTRAAFSAGPKLKRAVTAVGTGGMLAYPLDGCLPRDEFTIVIQAKPIGADASTLTNADVCKLFGDVGGGYVWLYATGGNLKAEINQPDSNITGGSNVNATASLAISVGDMPADTWKAVSVIWDGTTLRVMLGDNTKSATAAFAAAGLTRPFTGDPLRSSGVVLGADRAAASNGKFTVSDPVILRYARTYNTKVQKKPATITVTAGTTQGTFPRGIAGVVDHYSGFTVDETDNATLRDPQLALLTQAGVSAIRTSQFHRRAVPAGVSGGAVTSIDYTKHDAFMARIAATGAELHLNPMFTPTALGASDNTVPSDFDAYADYVSKVLAHTSALHTVSPVLSFWNEPTNGWTGTVSQMANLWLKVAQKIQASNPGFTLGGLDALWEIGGNATSDMAYQKAVIDIAAANSLPLPQLFVHYYQGDIAGLLKVITDMKAYAASKGYPDVIVQLTEFNYALGTASTTSAFLHSIEVRKLSAYNAAWTHAMLTELADAGGTYGVFYRPGEEPSEINLHMLSADAAPTPTPVFGGYQLLWKHAGNRVQAVSNWPGVRVLASKTAGGQIMVTYSSHRPYKRKDVVPIALEWSGLPAKFNWVQWRVDYRNTDARPLRVASGNQSNLPLVIDTTAVGMGGLQITPA